MCDAVVVPKRPEKLTVRSNVSATGSKMIVDRPVAGELFGGTSFAPESVFTNVIGAAVTTGADNTMNK
jgi:hypothetical protein